MIRALLNGVGHYWNWKAAVASAACRACVFFVANLPAGYDAAWSAWRVELVYRLIASGFYGALTERFSRWSARRRATVSALILLPALGHTVEYLVHLEAGTARAGSAVLASVLFTVVTTRFNLFAMRRGVFLSGAGRQPLRQDIRSLMRLVISVITSSYRTVSQSLNTTGPRAHLTWRGVESRRRRENHVIRRQPK